jgi:hypothetical protein
MWYCPADYVDRRQDHSTTYATEMDESDAHEFIQSNKRNWKFTHQLNL